ncbi:MAG: hydrophobe/amphiphile efflux-3 (HAE3) family transporter [Dehalococcoidia bacterium]
MSIKNIPLLLARFIERRSWWLIIVAVIITAVLVPGLTQLKQETGMNTMLSPDKEVFQDTHFYYERFGSESNAILLEGDLEDIFSTETLLLLDEMERELLDSHENEIHSLVGPVSVLKLAAEEAGKMGFSFEWDDPQFVNNVLHYQGGGLDSIDEGAISPQMAPLIPDESHVLINVRPVEGLTHEEHLAIVRDIERFFEQSREQGQLQNIDASVIADVEIMETISNAMTSDLKFLLGLSMGVMAAILLLMFRVRWNLLSLVMVGLAAAWTFGAMGYAGVPLSMSSMAVLPILIGIGIDYSIQFHNRYQEEVSATKSVPRSIISSIKVMVPVVVIALIATIIGFITLFISEVPMVQDFGMNLAIGVVVAFIVALGLLHSILNIADRRIPVTKAGKSSEAAILLFERLLAASAKFSLKHPAPILILAMIVAVAGGVADNWLPTKVDHEELMPQNSQTLKDMRYLREVTGYSGELHFLVTTDDILDPAVIEWMNDYQDRMMLQYPEEIKRVDSPATIITGRNEPSEEAGPIPPTRSEIEGIVASTPEMYVDEVMADTQIASLSIGLKHMEVDEIHELAEDLIESADPPPELNVSIAPAGNLALITEAVDAMMGRRTLMNAICLGAIFAVLFLVYRRFTRVLFAIIPVGMVLGWSSFTLFAMGIPLTMMTAVLGVLVIGIGTEFIVLLLGRYEEEKRQRGLFPHDAMIIAISRTGRAIVTTALTTLGGFGVLIASDFVLIHDFGIATTISLALCLFASMVVMPPLVVWWDTRVAKRLPKEIADRV